MAEMPQFEDGHVLGASSLNEMSEQIDELSEANFGQKDSERRPLVRAVREDQKDLDDKENISLDFSSVSDDPDDMWDSDDADRLTVQTEGVWLVQGQAVLKPDGDPGSGGFDVSITLNGTSAAGDAIVCDRSPPSEDGHAKVYQLVSVRRFEKGDKVRMQFYTNVGADMKVISKNYDDGHSYGGTYLTMTFLGP